MPEQFCEGRQALPPPMQAARELAAETDLDRLRALAVGLAVEASGARRGALLEEREGAWVVTAGPRPDEEGLVLPRQEAVREVARSGAAVVHQGAPARWQLLAALEGREATCAVACLESDHDFAQERVEAVAPLLPLAGIALENARTYAALRESEERYRRFVDTATEGVWAIGPDGRTTFVNASAARMLGFAPPELVGRPLSDFLSEDDVPDVGRRAAVRAQGVSETFERRFRRKDGSLVWALVSATPLHDEKGRYRGAFAMLADITERRRAEEALRAERGMFVAGPTVVFKWRAEEGWPVEYVSPNVEAVLGFLPDEMLAGKVSYAAVVHPEDLARVADEVARYAREGAASFEQRYRVVRKDGRVRWIDDYTTVARGADGTVTHFLGYVLDVTGRRQAEEALHRLNRELRALSSCNEALVRAGDEKALLDQICRIVCEQAGHRMAWVGYGEADASKTIRPVAWAGHEAGYLQQARLSWAEDAEQGRGPTGTAIRTGRTVYAQDIAGDSRMAPWRREALQRGYRSSVALPLKDERGEPFGALSVYAGEPHAFTPDEVRLLEELGGDLAFGVGTLRSRAQRRRAQRSVALLSFALNETRDAAFLIEENARFAYVNEAACRLLGYSREELLRLGVSDVDPDFPLERWLAHWKELKAEGALTFEGRHRAKDGHLIPVEISASYLEYEGQGYNLALVRDITERKRTQELVQARERELRVLLENLPDHVSRFDRGGRIVYFNAPMRGELGPGLEREVGQTILETEGPTGSREGNRELHQALMRAVHEGVPNELESWWRTAAGRRCFEVRHVPVRDEAGAVYGAIGIARDVTERKQSEQERERLLRDVQQERSRLQVVLDTAPVGISFYLAPDGRQGLCNRAAEAILGRPVRPEAMSLAERVAYYGIRLPSGEPFPPEELPLGRSLRGEQLAGVELLIRQPSGRQVSVVEHAAPLRDERGRVVGAVVAFQDITPVKEQERLREEFIAAAAHELKTPVTTVRGWAELLRRWSPREREQRQEHALEVILAQTVRIDHRVREMLEVFRLRKSRAALARSRFDLGELAANVAERMRMLAPGHRLVVRREGPSPVEADRERLEEVLASLLQNAFDASPAGSEVAVGVRAEAGQAVVSVRDRGVGIPRERQRHVFEPFFEPLPAGAAGYRSIVGLSLYLSRLTLERHRGRIWLESEEGKGSTFFFSVPLMHERPGGELGASAAPDAGGG